MKIKNSTDWPNNFLRRMTAWCCRELKMSPGLVSSIQFRNRNDGRTSGRAYWPSNRIVVSAGVSFLKYKAGRHHSYYGSSNGDENFRNRIDWLVRITAHELFHILAHDEGVRTRRFGRSSGSSEKHTKHYERKVYESFLANRDALLAEWSAEPEATPVPPKPTRQELNDAKSRKQLATWERKLKLAKTKVAAYRRKVRYYDRVAATRAKPEEPIHGPTPEKIAR